MRAVSWLDNALLRFRFYVVTRSFFQRVRGADRNSMKSLLCACVAVGLVSCASQVEKELVAKAETLGELPVSRERFVEHFGLTERMAIEAPYAFGVRHRSVELGEAWALSSGEVIEIGEVYAIDPSVSSMGLIGGGFSRDATDFLAPISPSPFRTELKQVHFFSIQRKGGRVIYSRNKKARLSGWKLAGEQKFLTQGNGEKLN